MGGSGGLVTNDYDVAIIGATPELIMLLWIVRVFFYDLYQHELMTILYDLHRYELMNIFDDLHRHALMNILDGHELSVLMIRIDMNYDLHWHEFGETLE